MKIPKKKKWPKGLPKPGSAKYRALTRRIAENKKTEAAIEAAKKAIAK
jgi:hypothetical protein